MKTLELEIEKNLILNINFLNLTLEFNAKIKDYEAYGIETPKNIQETLIDINRSANLIYVYSDCIAIAKSFNESNLFLHKIFYIRSIIRTVHEGLKIIKKYENHLFTKDLENEKVKAIIQLLRNFKKSFNLKTIQDNRNKVCSHYPDDFIEHHTTISNIDVKSTLEMFSSFLNIITQINIFFTTVRFTNENLNTIFTPYFKDVEEKLLTLGNQEN